MKTEYRLGLTVAAMTAFAAMAGDALTAGLLFNRSFDGTIQDRIPEGVKQTGAYAMKAGDVFEQTGEQNPPVYIATPRGKGIHRYSPWYHTLSVPNDFTLAIACRCTSAPNEILADFGEMRGEDESLMLATESANSVQLAVVTGVHPQVARSVSIPVKGGVDGFHTYVLRRGANDTVTVAVDGVPTGKSIVYHHTSSRFQLLGGYNKQRELANYAHGCRNEANVIDDARIWGRVLGDGEVAKYTKEFPAGGPTSVSAAKGADATERVPPGRGGVPPPPAINVEWPALKHYDREHIKQTVLPLGGIGCGTIGLMGRGELRDWELFNNPSVGRARNRPVFAITAKGAKTPTASVLLAGPIEDHEQVEPGGNPCPYSGYPRFAEATMDAAFPFGTVHLRDPKLPYRVDLKAFSPFVPGDSATSSTPVASFEYVVENLTDEPLEVSIANFGRTIHNAYNQVRESDSLFGLEAKSNAGGKAIDSGSYVLVTEKAGGKITYRTSGIADGWRTNALDFWDDFTDDGRLEPREFLRGTNPFGALCVAKTIPARGKVSFRFAYMWNFPNRYGWCKSPVGNWYSKNYADGWDAAQKIWPKLPELAARTARFVKAFVSSDLPEPIKDAALNNLSVLTSHTLFRDREGRLMGYEGMGNNAGWCKGTTTHVWNYEFATGALFGDLARSTREIEFKHSTFDDGWMVIRHNLPLGTQTKQGWDGRTAADGQMGTVMRAYREWIWSGDTEWLKSIWPKVKVALEFAWKGASKWDPNADGIMEGEQHNTFDINFYGPNPLCQFWYLGALRAGEEMAQAMGDQNFAAECRRIFESGRKLTDEKLFNGDYYWQIIPEDKKGEIFQLGTGCLSDQLLGQMAAHILGLGDLGVRAHERKACESIMKYNFLEDFTHHFCDRRTYCAGDDKGLLISSWPRGGREKVPFVYFSEVWTGIEYVAAAEMIYQGMDKDALKIVAAARTRHDGRRRNPFNEFECGYHYARSLASWNLQLAWSGFLYNGVKKEMSFGRDGKWFWSTGGAFGTAQVRGKEVKVDVIEGKLPAGLKVSVR